METTGEMRRILAPFIEDQLPNGQGEQGFHCPLEGHDDERRSASVNFDKGVWWCMVCQRGGTVAALSAAMGAGRPVRGTVAQANGAAANGAGKVGALRTAGQPVIRDRYGNVVVRIDDAQILTWHEALLEDAERHLAFTLKRGLTLETLSEFMIGWSQRYRAYTIPIPDFQGEWQNVRFYDLSPQGGRRKIWSITGYGEPILYPFDQLEYDSILICEGEWDALLAIQNGFSAITRTSTADAWRSNWTEFFTDKDVWLCHDMDEKGQRANDQLTEQLTDIASSVTVIKLPYSIEEKHGKDLTDYFYVDGHSFRDFLGLMEQAHTTDLDVETLPLSEDSQFIDLNVLETFNAKHYRERIKLRATVVGQKHPTYMVPKAANYKCSQDLGSKCSVCKINDKGGAATIEIDPEDAILLKLMGAPESRINELMQRAAGIPGKCPIVQIDITALQSLEEIFVRPDIDSHRLSHEAGDYTPRTIIAVGHHDTLTNQTVETKGSIWPNPRDQHNEYLASQLTLTTSSIDSFTMTEDMYEHLRGFSTRGDPLAKAVEVARDLERHVTGIRGRTEMHVLMDLAFYSILAFPLHGAILQRGWLDVLVVGDTRTGKSEAATALLHHYGAGELVSGESTSFAGIVGGLEQMGGKEWSIKWGAIPMNDRRLVVIDEISGLSTEQISNMSSIRSSGEAVITKIHTERTLARTRLIWLGNPREARMSDFTYGVSSIKPLIGNPEDIARFDLAMSLRSGEVPLDQINQAPSRDHGAAFTRQMCNDLLMWCWSRRAEHVVWADGVEEELRHEAMALGQTYIDDPPLIQGENVRTKIARIAVALAARTFNSPDGEHLLVEGRHLYSSIRFINKVYGMRSFGYKALSETRLGEQQKSSDLREAARQYLDTKPELREFLATHAGRFKRVDLQDLLNYDEGEARATINQLWGLHMFRMTGGYVVPQPVLNDILREG